MKQQATLEISRSTSAEGCVVRLCGVLNEELDREEVFKDIRGALVIDFDGVKRITSFGIREWLGALHHINADHYAFINCRPAVVAQLNMVAGFAGTGQVVSIYTPFICPECDEVTEVLYDLRHDYAAVASGMLRPPTCGHCKVAMELDELHDEYFMYVSSRPSPRLASNLNYLIDGGDPTVGRQLRIGKEISGHVTAISLSGVVDKGIRLSRALDGLDGFVLVDMTRVVLATRDGLIKLENALHQHDAFKVFYARMVWNVARIYVHLADDERKTDGIVSLLVKGRCSKCDNRPHVDLDRIALRKLDAGETVGVCSNCQSDLNIELSDTERSFADQYLRDAGAEIDAYLRRRPPNHAEHQESAVSSPITPSYRNRYQIIRPLGAGGMAEVFLAHQRGLEGFNKKVVLKRLLPTYSQSTQSTNMFLQEARIAAKISHPNVAQIFELGRDGDDFFIVMEFVDGFDLSHLLRSARSQSIQMPFNIACRIVSDICAGLHAAHATTDETGNTLGIVHRDVSPHNILVSQNGTIKLTDFGIAKARSSIVNTDPGTVKGKFSYLSPEQIDANFGEVGPESDVFSVGVILFQCLAGRTPFRRETDFQTMKATVDEPTPSISVLRPDVPEAVDRIIKKATSKDVNERYRSALKFREDLEAAMVQHGKATLSHDVAQWIQSLPQSPNAEAQLHRPVRPRADSKFEIDLSDLDASAVGNEDADATEISIHGFDSITDRPGTKP